MQSRPRQLRLPGGRVVPCARGGERQVVARALRREGRQARRADERFEHVEARGEEQMRGAKDATIIVASCHAPIFPSVREGEGRQRTHTPERCAHGRTDARACADARAAMLGHGHEALRVERSGVRSGCADADEQRRGAAGCTARARPAPFAVRLGDVGRLTDAVRVALRRGRRALSVHRSTMAAARVDCRGGGAHVRPRRPIEVGSRAPRALLVERRMLIGHFGPPWRFALIRCA